METLRKNPRAVLIALGILALAIAAAIWNYSATSLDVPDGHMGVAVSHEGEVSFLEPGSHAYVKEENRVAYMVALGENTTTLKHCMHNSWLGAAADFARGSAWVPNVVSQLAGKYMEEKQVKQTCTNVSMTYQLNPTVLRKLAHTAQLGDFETMIFIPNLRGAFERAMETVRSEQSGGVMADAWRFVRRADEPTLDVEKARERLYELMSKDVAGVLMQRFGLEVSLKVHNLEEVTVVEELDLAVLDSVQVNIKPETSGIGTTFKFGGKVILFVLLIPILGVAAFIASHFL